ncbi:kelch-like protein 7 [Ptychodera flava]|uniref:kelch-like protein 7 n=1 Tax=Ptychodera flava TaxID=63121 RepID=UPI00396A9FBE
MNRLQFRLGSSTSSSATNLLSASAARTGSSSPVEDVEKEDNTVTVPTFHSAPVKRQSRFLAAMNVMRKQQELCDVELMVDGKAIASHRVVLAACSAFFHAMFTSKYTEAENAKVELKEVDSGTVETLVNFAYTGDIELTSSNVQSIMSAANRYQINDVIEMCVEFLKRELSPENCLGIREFANFLNSEKLHVQATKYSHENFTEVCKHEEFFEMSFSHVTDYLSKDELVVRCEDEVFDAAVQWIKYKKEERMPLRTQVFEKIRFPLITKGYLSTVVESDETMQDDSRCLKMLVSGMKHHLLDKEKRENIGIKDVKPRAKKHNWHIAVFSGSEPDTCQWFNEQGSAGIITSSGNKVKHSWITIPSMPEKRRDHAVACINNVVYIVGGSYLFPLHRIDCFNISTQEYSTLTVQLESARDMLAACACKGMLYITGGTTNHGSTSLKSTECYDPVKQRWFSKQPMFYARYDHAMVELNGWLYVCGGASGGACNRRPLKSCEKFYSGPNVLMNNRWAEIAPMNAARKGLGLAVVNEFIYAIGGTDEHGTLESVERYDPKQNQWKMVAKLPSKLTSVKCGVLNGSIYVVAAQRDVGRLSQVLEYRPAEDRWVFHYNVRAFNNSNAAVTVVDVCAVE